MMNRIKLLTELCKKEGFLKKLSDQAKRIQGAEGSRVRVIFFSPDPLNP